MSHPNTLKEIADWLQNEAEERMKQVVGRRDGARSMRNATEADLRSAKALAEKMSGHKLRGVSTSVESAVAYAGMQERISEKLENEARQLSHWSDLLLSLQPLRNQAVRGLGTRVTRTASGNSKAKKGKASE